MKSPQSFTELQTELRKSKESYLLIYKSGSEQSDCALSGFLAASSEQVAASAFRVDVNFVRDVHPALGINTAPTLVIFNEMEIQSIIKGCQSKEFYEQVLGKNSFGTQTGTSDRPSKSVVVYSTPTCSWCNTLKSWLRKNQVAFREVDVSRDQSAAEAMVRKSGQQGVPQTEINGQIVVGFDQSKLKNLLGINS